MGNSTELRRKGACLAWLFVCGLLLKGPALAAEARSEPTWVEVDTAGVAVAGADQGDDQVASDAVLMEVDAEPGTPYVRSRVRYRVRVLARVPLRDATLSEPMAEGARVRRLGQDRRFDTRRNGRDYRVIERLYVVVPRRAGSLVIHGPTLRAAVPLRAIADRGLDDGLLTRRALVERTPEPLALTVRPPPEGASRPWLPAESLSISEEWEPEPEQALAGEPLLRRVSVEAFGVGLGGVALPDVPSVEGLRIYTEPVRSEELVVGEDLAVRVEQAQTLVPTKDGLVRVPELIIPWWSLGMDEQRLARLPSRDLLVGSSSRTPDAAATDEAMRRRFLERATADPWGWGWLLLSLAIILLVTLAVLIRERRRRGPRQGRAGRALVAEPTASDCGARFRRACERNDPTAARAALGAWARAEGLSQQEGRGIASVLRARGDAGEAAAALMELDRVVYGHAGNGAAAESKSSPGRKSKPWQGTAALGAIAPLLGAAVRAKRSVDEERLPPLFPESGPGGR